MSLLELLEAGEVEKFNASRTDRGRLDLFAADLPDLSLVGVDLSNANVDKADLTGSDLSDANLCKASMTGIDGGGMKLRSAIAVRLRLKEAFLDRADLSRADLSHADLAEAVLTGSLGEGVRLVQARLREANAAGASWPEADLSEASLHKADFTEADLRRADLTEATAVEANLTGARLDSATGKGLKASSAVLVRASLTSARLPEANLSGADLTGANLGNADLTGANLTGANLTDADLRGAILADACLDGCTFDGADLTGADLTGIDPRGLPLSPAQLASLGSVGVPVDQEAPLHFTTLDVAATGSRVAILWENPDTDELTTLRYAVLRGAESTTGIVPVATEGVVARGLASDGDGFRLIVLRQRPGGMAVQTWFLDRNGKLGAPDTAALGYEPGVRPVLRHVDGRLHMWGLARRGPTLVVHAQTEEGLKPVHSEKVATARGFLGRHHPILACKGDVIMACDHQRAGKPQRTPPGFPGQLCSAAPFDGQVLAVWVQAPGELERGGLHAAWLGTRGGIEVTVLGRNPTVMALDALADERGVWVGWIEADDGVLGASTVKVVHLPDGDPVTVEIADADELSLVNLGGRVHLVLTTLHDEVVVCSPAGVQVAHLQGGGGA